MWMKVMEVIALLSNSRAIGYVAQTVPDNRDVSRQLSDLDSAL